MQYLVVFCLSSCKLINYELMSTMNLQIFWKKWVHHDRRKKLLEVSVQSYVTNASGVSMRQLTGFW